jgi:hypothetical protein
MAFRGLPTTPVVEQIVPDSDSLELGIAEKMMPVAGVSSLFKNPSKAGTWTELPSSPAPEEVAGDQSVEMAPPVVRGRKLNPNPPFTSEGALTVKLFTSVTDRFRSTGRPEPD